MKVKVFRPHLDDVESLSYGKGAKKQRGTGSRSVCHRLNKDERKLYELAKQAGYLTVRGTGYRKERKGSPLCNIYRQRCDALEEICVIIEKRTEEDMVVIDLSTLRVKNDSTFLSLILENVLKGKYPDLYLDADSNVSFKDDVSNGARRKFVSKSSVTNPIDWEVVKTKPIWGVNERLITVTCARDVAKALAIDVLKESKNFDVSEMSEMDELKEQRSSDDEIIKAAQIDGDEKATIIRQDVDDDSSIDWDDI
jgi:hypothetical protein